MARSDLHLQAPAVVFEDGGPQRLGLGRCRGGQRDIGARLRRRDGAGVGDDRAGVVAGRGAQEEDEDAADIEFALRPFRGRLEGRLGPRSWRLRAWTKIVARNCGEKSDGREERLAAISGGQCACGSTRAGGRAGVA
jgi:hypothetical protein